MDIMFTSVSEVIPVLLRVFEGLPKPDDFDLTQPDKIYFTWMNTRFRLDFVEGHVAIIDEQDHLVRDSRAILMERLISVGRYA